MARVTRSSIWLDWGKQDLEQDDPHKNNPEPIRGGCGLASCPICYDQSTGELRAEDGKYQGGEALPRDISAQSAAELSARASEL